MDLVRVWPSDKPEDFEVLDCDNACNGDPPCGGCDRCILAQLAHYGGWECGREYDVQTREAAERWQSRAWL